MLPERDLDFVKQDPQTPKTQLVMVTGLLLISILLDNMILAYVALGIGLLSLMFKPAGDFLVWVWYKIAEILSRVVNPIVLGLVYFIFISPIALLFRAFGNDPLSLKRPKGSLYELREKTFGKEDLEKPF
ncbi:hypothetical protein AB2B38_011480 [Balneola sp. MJW-20]|uniref:hypothetical protein n=1 Tax=Gracilimonas aurantiaca TaxID=3234185 RepID=UPI003465A33E